MEGGRERGRQGGRERWWEGGREKKRERERSEHLLSCHQKSVTISAGPPLYPHGIAYRRAYGSSTPGLFQKRL